MRQDAQGLTLLELLVAIAVMGVLLGIGVPSFQNLQRRMRADTTFNVLTASLAVARGTAVKIHSSVSVCPSSDGRFCRSDAVWDHGWIVFKDPARGKQPASADAILHRFERVSRGLAVRSTVGRTRVRYDASGMSRGSNVTIRFCSTSDHHHVGSVVVNNAGRPRTVRYHDAPCPFAL